MTSDPSVIRAQIEETRASLSDNVDELADQANPAHIAHRQVDKARRAGSRLLDRVLGTAEDVRDVAVDKAHDLAAGVREAGDNLTDLPDRAGRQAQGNPLAAGVVAFGIGLLLAAAFPASRKEQELAEAVKEKAQPLTDKVTEAAHEVADNLAEPAAQAMDTLKESAGEAVRTVREEGSAAVDDIQGVTQDSVQDVAESARDSADSVRTEARDAAQG
ncbi:MAG: DUF3618 domain-containing protein [Propionibacteriaceae bacterium]|jgi:hypothetical protein|nr:DUF3618 domain-containing protein [Propionibacteriaceae bacterium]